MSRCALVDPFGSVVNVVDLSDDPDTHWQNPDGLTMIDDPAQAASIGDTFKDGEFLKSPPAVIPQNTSQLTKYAAAKRYGKEIGGIVVSGIPVDTDDRAKQMILGARVAADVDPSFTTQWVGSDGSVYPVDAAMMKLISDAVLAHVASCFATYASVKHEIDVGSFTTFSQIDAAFQ